MNIRFLKHSLVAAVGLAGAIALSPVSQALAGDTSVTLGNGDTATVQSGSTMVSVDSDGHVVVHTDNKRQVDIRPAAGADPAGNDATATPHIGDRLADGTIYAGHNFAATPADAPALYTWFEARDYCNKLEANGHDDWALPTKHLLNQLYQNKDTGAFTGTFNNSALNAEREHFYWSSKEGGLFLPFAWHRSFTNRLVGWGLKDYVDLSVRCVRPVPAGP